MNIDGLDTLIVPAELKINPDDLTGKRLCDVAIGHIISASGAENSKARKRPAPVRPTTHTRMEEIIDGCDFI